MKVRGSRGLALAFVAIVTLSMVAGVAAAAMSINPGADPVQDPQITEGELTKEAHTMGDHSLLEYENDNGEIASLPAELNTSADNPITYNPTLIDVSDFSAFPHSAANTSALEASEWSTDASGTAGSIAVSDVTPEPGVDGLEIAASSQTSGDTAVATFDNFSVDDDAEKRVAQIAVHDLSLTSGATIDVEFVDDDGDVKRAVVNESLNRSSDNVIATSGGSYVYQAQLGGLATDGADGDGQFDNIDQVRVAINDADATVQITGLNAEKMSEWDFGTTMEDTDGDDDLETVDVTEPAGTIDVTGLDTLGGTFSSATLYNVQFPVNYGAEHLSETNVDANWTSAADYPNFEHQLDLYYRLEVPGAYDLSHAQLSLDDDLRLPGDRFQTVEYVEGAGDTDFADLSGWSDVTTTYTSSSKGASVTVDDTVEVGKSYAVHYSVLMTDGERDAAESGGAVAAGGGQEGGSSLPLIGGLIALLGSLWAGARSLFN